MQQITSSTVSREDKNLSSSNISVKLDDGMSLCVATKQEKHIDNASQDEETPLLSRRTPSILSQSKCHLTDKGSVIQEPLTPLVEPTVKGYSETTKPIFVVHRRVASENIFSKMPHFHDETSLLPPRQAVHHFRSNTQTNISESSLIKDQSYDQTEQERLIRIAACYLMDFEESRPATLFPDPDRISWNHLRLHRIRFSRLWQSILVLAALGLVGSSYFDYSPKNVRTQWNCNTLNSITLGLSFIFLIDVIVLQSIYRVSFVAQSARQSRSKWWAIPLILVLIALDVETITKTVVEQKEVVWSGIFKPVAFFYLFQQARDALEALRRIFSQLVNVLFMELFFILIFSAIAREMYGDLLPQDFGSLDKAFVSMFQLSTAVVNPSLWMPIYIESRSSAVFFVCFLISTFFYFHSLVLSVVFQSYMQAMSNIRERYSTDREDNIRLAFRALHSFDKFRRDRTSYVHVHGNITSALIPLDTIKKVLKLLRPNYDQRKIDALSEFIGLPGEHSIGFERFRSRIPKALAISVRTVKPWNWRASIFKQWARTVAVLNILYVGLCTVPPQRDEILGKWMIPIGLIVTLLSGTDLVIRFASGQICFVLPRIQLDFPFDAASTVSVLISLFGGLCWTWSNNFQVTENMGLKLLLIGRMIDMLRFMRQFVLVRLLAKRTTQVLHSISGPVILLLTTVHILTYIGMALWGGLIVEGETPGTTEYYDFNNFNSYSSGLLTMFQVMVANDWHAIAQVFMTVSPRRVVIPFFIFSNLFLVSIILNVITAFFVGAFVSDTEEGNEPDHRRISINMNSNQESSLTVMERPTFDLIMKTVAGCNDNDDDGEAKQVCRVLEVFEALQQQSRNKVAYLVSCQQAMARFGNARFQSITRPFIDEEVMHVLLSDMQSELLIVPKTNAKDVVLTRQFTKPDGKLELRASLLKESPPMTLFVATLLTPTASFAEAS